MSVISILGNGSNSSSLKNATPTDSPTLPRNPNRRLSALGENENEITKLLLEVFGRKCNIHKLLNDYRQKRIETRLRGNIRTFELVLIELIHFAGR